MTKGVVLLQQDNFSSLSRLNRNHSKDSKDRYSLGYFQARLQRLEEVWQACQERHGAVLDDLSADSDKRKSYLEEYEKIEETYLDLLTRFKSGMVEYQSTSSPTDSKGSSATNRLQLERLAIPKFDGKYSQWRTFNDMFNSLIHNNETLSAVEKMQYLKTHVQGDAARVIQHLDVNNENYEAAVHMLRERFDNKRAMAWSCLHKFHKLPVAKEDCDSSIKQVMDVTAEFIANMNSIGVNTEHWDLLIIYSTSQKLDQQSRRLWESSLGASSELPRLKTFLEFLTSRFRTLEALNIPRKAAKIEALTTTTATGCSICGKDHYINQCDKFRAMDVQQRRSEAKKQNWCYNCLKKGHGINQCPSSSRCRTCSKKHHSLLHSNGATKGTQKLSADVKSFIPSAQSLLAGNGAQDQAILLATASVNVQNSSGRCMTLRALIDSGSQRSFITESAAQLLGLKRRFAKVQICGVGAVTNLQSKGCVVLAIRTKYGDSTINASALILPSITNLCPSITMPIKLPVGLSAGKLADPNYGAPGRIDILLGADMYDEIVLPGFKKGSPCAINTRFGWILLGPTTSPNNQESILSLITTEDTTDKLVKKFWEINEAPAKQPVTTDEQTAMDWYQQTTKRDESGRYVVRLPFKQDAEPGKILCNSQQKAHIRFSQLEKRLHNDDGLRSQYVSFMEEYLRLGHMVEVPAAEKFSKQTYYLPHHAVRKDDSTTTKLRVVFNASQAAPAGKSLNDILLIGPSIQNSITRVLMKWRTHRYVVAADIEKMYRQMLVHPQDQDYQRILWRSHPSEPIKHFKLTTVTYGTASAPYLAMRTLHQLAEDERLYHPEACRAIKEDFYVDDVLTGGETIEKAQNLQQDLIKVLQKGGFKLRKWAANHDTLLESIPISDREAISPLNINEDDHVKTLGLRWHPAKDCFFFKVTLEDISDDLLPKRQLLSEIAKLFDPMGWLQPCIVIGKIIIQQLWLQQTNWDEPVAEDIGVKWRNFRLQLPALQEISIPRWLHWSNAATVQVHGFCDASEAAYAAAIYVRIVERNGSTIVRLVTSKSKVAPLRVQSIPRLELCSAVLLCDLMTTTLEAHGWKDVRPYYWTDSMIVLQWLQSPAAKWKVFVANRVSHIHSTSDIKQWRHINSKANPADVASRGIFPSILQNHALWWNGPDWLKEHQDTWPKSKFVCNEAMACVEIRPRATCLTTVKVEEKENIAQRFSSFTKLIRVIAYCRRWRSKIRSSFLRTDELQQAESTIIRMIQQEAFANEIDSLKSNNKVDKSSSLIRLTPFLDQDQILRVGGRIQQSAVSFATKHPILIPRGHIANLVIKHYHHMTLHGPAQLVHSTVRTKYWIVDGLTAVKQFGRKCTHCFRLNAKPSHQLMGILPHERVRPGKPFSRTGMDFAGPITIKWSNGRGAKTTKAYIVVFVCLSTKAVHLELASDFTSKTCIAAIRRFIARRGLCHTLISDNGTNFVGADKLLREAAKKMIAETQENLAVININWKFIPPGSPHFGGIWEAAVKSMKRHLIKTLGSHLLNVEEMFTLLAQIEACMNSRPLTALSTDPHDLNALTPGHFLTGEHLFELPDGHMEDNVIRKWQLVQRLKQHFWQRWSLEYLTQLQQRAKWFTENKKIRVDDLVLIKYENQASCQWPLGRILAIHPGTDGLTRVVTLKTKDNIIKRPNTKICPLPSNEECGVERPSEDVITRPSTHKRKQDARPSKRTSKISKLMVNLFALLVCVTNAKASYTIKHPEPGVYVEHLGQVRLIKGHFRLNVNVSNEEIIADLQNTQQIYTNISHICKEGLRLHPDIRCTELVDQLGQEVNRTMEAIKPWVQVRKRRGILGNILQGIFGVNDEVYTDIEKLDENQNQIIKTMEHHGNLLLTTTQLLNETRRALNTKMNLLARKVDQVSKTMAETTSWYIDQNRINIQFLAAYQLAFGWLGHIQTHYEVFHKIKSGVGSIMEALSAATVTNTLLRAQEKLGGTLIIVPKEVGKTRIATLQSGITIFGSFHLVEPKKFELMHFTGIPRHLGNGNYSVPDITQNYFGVRYDDQIYFTLTPEQLTQCERIDTIELHCSVNILLSIGDHPNCVLDEIYDRFNKRPCPQHIIQVKSITWKQLVRSNTWLFLASTANPAALTCNGQRQDLKIEGVGILEMEPLCSLTSSTAILRTNPATFNSVTVHYTYVKPMIQQFNTTNTTFVYVPSKLILEQDDSFIQSIQHQEAMLRTDMTTTSWHHLRRQTIMIGSSCGLGFLVISAIIGALFCRIYQRETCQSTPQATAAPEPTSQWYDLTKR